MEALGCGQGPLHPWARLELPSPWAPLAAQSRLWGCGDRAGALHGTQLGAGAAKVQFSPKTPNSPGHGSVPPVVRKEGGFIGYWCAQGASQSKT